MELFDISFTGHRKIVLSDWSGINAGLSILEQESDATAFHTGGARGFDTAVFRRLGFHPFAINKLHIPFTYQWVELQQALGKSAAEITDYMAALCTECGPTVYHSSLKQLYLKRDRHMVDESKLLVCYYNGLPGGTEYTINYAKKQGVPVIDIRELTVDNLRERAEEARRR